LQGQFGAVSSAKYTAALQKVSACERSQFAGRARHLFIFRLNRQRKTLFFQGINPGIAPTIHLTFQGKIFSLMRQNEWRIEMRTGNSKELSELSFARDNLFLKNAS